MFWYIEKFCEINFNQNPFSWYGKQVAKGSLIKSKWNALRYFLQFV